MQIVLAILALSFLIIIHEFGHFAAAKIAGIKVLEFSLFMGPKLLSKKWGETEYSIRMVPIGGFVRMEGEEEASDDSRAYNKQPLYTRATVAIAGPFMNIFTAVIIFSIVFSIVGFRTTQVNILGEGMAAEKAGLQIGDQVVSFGGKRVYHPMDIELFMFVNKEKPSEIEYKRGSEIRTTTIIPERILAQKRYILGFVAKENEGTESNVVGNIVPDSNAGAAGLLQGDRIVALNGTPVSSKGEIGEFMEHNGGESVKVTVHRDGQGSVELTIEPTLSETPEYFNIGMDYATIKGGLFEVIKASLVYTYSTVRSVFYSIIWLITGTVSFKQMMGPVGIVTTIGDVVEQSPSITLLILSLLNITGFISINLGVMNLMPFPALDGSKLLLIGVEGIRKKAIPPEREALISLVGFVVLIMFMIFTTYNDIVRRFGGG
ncbi:MAG: RIP metalloprotease RseP [Acetivibrionales bacterium]|jgi:regulator of sigma E protease